MDPLQAFAMPTHGVLVTISSANSWRAGSDCEAIRFAYVATNSSEPLSFVSVHSATHPDRVAGCASRPSRLAEMSFGVVIELYLMADLAEGDEVRLALAHAGASIYYPAQPIDETS
jgi:hypothetical protein